MQKEKMNKGLNKNIIKTISEYKNENIKMLNIRMQAYESFLKQKNPTWECDIKDLDFNDFIYYNSIQKDVSQSWDDVPEKVKKQFEQLGILEAEAKYLNGITTQYDSEAIYHSALKEVTSQGVIFSDTDTALKEYPELFYKYFNKLVPASDNKFAALNTAVWSGGTFIYVPPGVKLTKPLQSYFRINYQSLGQFERTLIIVDKNASLHYVEGCTAPIYNSNNLHAAVVELYIKEGGELKYTTIQNWSDNVLNYVTKRALVHKNAKMTWIDGNIGSKHNIKFPCCILAGEGASGSCISIAVANNGIIQNSGAKMIHLAPNTKSNIISKSIGYANSKSIFRGYVDIRQSAINSTANISCDTLLLADNLISETLPYEKIANNDSTINHEAKISKISEEQLYFLMSKGISAKDAEQLLIVGFIDIFSRELPMEYAVELNRLLKIEI